MRTTVEIDSSSISWVFRFWFVKSTYTRFNTQHNTYQSYKRTYNQLQSVDETRTGTHFTHTHHTARRNSAHYRSSSSASTSVRRRTTRLDGFPSRFAFQLFVLAPLPTFRGVSKWIGRMKTHGSYVWMENGYLIFPAKYSKYKHTQKTFMQYHRFMHMKCLQFVCSICATPKAPPFNFNQPNCCINNPAPADININANSQRYNSKFFHHIHNTHHMT